MNVIDPGVLKQWEAAAQQFASSEPFRFVVIKDFLESDLCRSLSADFPSFEEKNALNEMGRVGGKAVRMDVRDISDSYRMLDDYLRTPEFLGLVSRLTGIPDLLFDPDYVGGGTHENRDGQELDAHVDFNFHPRTKWHRRLNLIVYLNDIWESDWGGELELHSDPWDRASNRSVRVKPLLNTAVIFETTENSWHGFSRIQLPENARSVSRKSFAIYLYTRERAANETAPPHATIYVPELMPNGWQAGRTLSSTDLAELDNRFARIRSQLRFLYDREKEFGRRIANLESALSEIRDSQRLELQGYAIQPRGTSGMWFDGWVSRELSAVFVPTRKASSLTLELWAPRQLPDDQVLQIEIDGVTFTQILVRGAKTPVTLGLSSCKGREVVLRVLAQLAWVPAQAADSADERELAYKILGASLDH